MNLKKPKKPTKPKKPLEPMYASEPTKDVQRTSFILEQSTRNGQTLSSLIAKTVKKQKITLHEEVKLSKIHVNSYRYGGQVIQVNMPCTQENTQYAAQHKKWLKDGPRIKAKYEKDLAAYEEKLNKYKDNLGIYIRELALYNQQESDKLLRELKED